MNSKELLPDHLIDLAWQNADFGIRSKREVIFTTLLKCALGYSAGRIAICIVTELKLVTPDWKLTDFGKEYMFTAYNEALNDSIVKLLEESPQS